MRRDVRGDGALAVARDAARALGAEGLTGASPMPAALPCVDSFHLSRSSRPKRGAKRR